MPKFNMGGYDKMRAAIPQGLPFAGPASPPERQEFLFGIPLQVGPATDYARRVRHWLHFILVMQAVGCALRFIILWEVFGAFWMAMLCALGWYAWKQDMNITYICCWGLACMVNALFDIFGAILSFVFISLCALTHLPVMQGPFMQARCAARLAPGIVHITVAFSELMGAAFAWHLYADYRASHGEKAPGIDPWGAVEKRVHDFDPEQIKILHRGKKGDSAAQGDQGQGGWYGTPGTETRYGTPGTESSVAAAAQAEALFGDDPPSGGAAAAASTTPPTTPRRKQKPCC